MMRRGRHTSTGAELSVNCGIVTMKEKGVYLQALIKKRGCGWPNFIPGDENDNYFSNKPIGHIATLSLQVIVT
ncbi:hypothetical protein ACHAXS_000697 [Conticribra weissflogii]